MEHGSIEREIHIDASPEVVFEVVSSPEHLQEWWADEVDLASPTPGTVGELVFGDRADPKAHLSALTVVAADPPRLFSFRWVSPEGEPATATNSLLVTMEIVPQGEGSLLRLTETGFRERGWEVAVLEEQYQDHVRGWDHFVPRLGEYAARLVSHP